jgi:hypothetical protein
MAILRYTIRKSCQQDRRNWERSHCLVTSGTMLESGKNVVASKLLPVIDISSARLLIAPISTNKQAGSMKRKMLHNGRQPHCNTGADSLGVHAVGVA